MKKFSILILFCISSALISAQFSSTGIYKSYQQITSNKDTVLVFMFTDIKPATDIKYTGNGTNISWYTYSNLTTALSTGTKEIYNPDDATGYVVDIDGKKTSIWVIDYSKYLPVLKSISTDNSSANPCEEIKLQIEATITKLNYKTISGKSYELPREFNIKYQTVKWEAEKWVTDSLTVPTVLPISNISVKAPLCDTQFKLSGDQYALALGIDTIQKVSSTYKAVAVECHLGTVVTSRKQSINNEEAAPSKELPISYSVPIDVQFLSNANNSATFFNWNIYKDGQLIVNRTDRDHRFTFLDYGTYKVKIRSSNSSCAYSDSITINAYEARIQVPNVFTPNGDTYNEEFRIAYKSLLAFECWVYNRWGRKVYYWADPAKGWDGKINGKDAAEGPYFYVIKATGFGLDPKAQDMNKKSTIILKGDINLLRGSKK